MKVLVTGGCGFIGANFLNLFVKRFPGHSFLNLDKLTYAANPLSLGAIATLPNYDFVRADVAEPDEVEAALERFDPDLIVHFAAESHVDRSIHGPREFVRTNIAGTFNLLEACRARWAGGGQGSGKKLFHHVSTDEVYGSLGDAGRFTETTRYDPSSPYSASKASSDHLVAAYHRTYGLPVKITNCSNNYGPYQFPEKLIPLMICNALERKPLPIYGTGRNVRDWLYVEDHCEAIWAVIERGRVGETYNVGGGAEMRNLEVVDLLCRLLAEETGVSERELIALKTLVPDRPGHDLRYAIDASKVKAECGWAPRESFESGLRKTVRWYLANATWIDGVRTGEYRRWVELNYGQRSGRAAPDGAARS
jgi:dTDP-glucose 4,6-dehydratase